MTFVDANYFLRFLLADNLAQHQKAKNLFLDAAKGEIKLFTSLVAIFETYWTLRSFYKKDKNEIAEYLNKIMSFKFLELEHKEILIKALGIYKSTSLGLPDSFNLVYTVKYGAGKFATFDEKLQKAFAKLES